MPEWLQLWPSQIPGFPGSGAGDLTELAGRMLELITGHVIYLTYKQVHRVGRRSIWPN